MSEQRYSPEFRDETVRQGTLFRTAYTTCNVTGPSHASIMTGLYPRRHGMLGSAWRPGYVVDGPVNEPSLFSGTNGERERL